MRRLVRVEFSDGLRASHAQLVLMIELPGQVMLQLRAERAVPQARALQVALRALPERDPAAPGRPLRLLSNTPAQLKTPEAFGEPAYTAPGGCRAGSFGVPSRFPASCSAADHGDTRSLALAAPRRGQAPRSAGVAQRAAPW
jgi:hypothetical protein